MRSIVKVVVAQVEYGKGLVSTIHSSADCGSFTGGGGAFLTLSNVVQIVNDGTAVLCRECS